MSHAGVKALLLAIHGALDYSRKEFDLSYAEAVGVMEIVKHDLMVEASDVQEIEG